MVIPLRSRLACHKVLWRTEWGLGHEFVPSLEIVARLGLREKSDRFFGRNRLIVQLVVDSLARDD